MQPKQLLVLTLVVAVLGGFIFFYEKDLPSTEERAERAKKVLLLEEDAIDSIVIAWDDHKVQLERDRADDADEDSKTDAQAEVSLNEPIINETIVNETSEPSDTWRLTSPLDARADAAAIDGLLRSLIDLESERKLEEIDREELGLASPRASVTLSSGTAESAFETTLEIGADIPASSDMIVAIAGHNTAFQVASNLFEELTKTPGDWRDKKLFLASRGAIEQVALDGSHYIELARRGDDFWLAAPLSDRAEEGKVNGLLSSLTGLTVKSFIDSSPMTPEGMGLEPAHGTVEVQLAANDQPFRFELGAEKESEPGVYYGRIGSQIFEVETALAASLTTTPAEWRSLAWTSLQVFGIETAQFRGSNLTVELTRDGADWRRGKDRVAYSAVSDVLYPITEIKGELVVERNAALSAGYKLDTPSLSISLTTKDSAEELELFEAVDGQVAAMTGGRDAVLLLPEDKAAEIHSKLEELMAAEPLPEEPEASEEAASEDE